MWCICQVVINMFSSYLMSGVQFSSSIIFIYKACWKFHNSSTHQKSSSHLTSVIGSSGSVHTSKFPLFPFYFLLNANLSFYSKLTSIGEYVPEEQCTFCSATLSFESPEEAFCRAVSCNGGAGKGHRLARCSVSMQVCPVTPSWFCVCCHRRASKLAPHSLLSTPKYPRDLSFNTKTNTLEVSPKPFCPFCGILLQRLQPEFLLSASPV